MANIKQVFLSGNQSPLRLLLPQPKASFTRQSILGRETMEQQFCALRPPGAGRKRAVASGAETDETRGGALPISDDSPPG